MTPAREKLLDFLRELAREDKQAEAENLAMEALRKLDGGTLDKGYLKGLLPRALPLMKPVYAEEVKSLILQYAMGGMGRAFGDK